MTEITPLQEKNIPLAVFLNSVCPGTPYLDDNTFFSLGSFLKQDQLEAIGSFNWPLSGTGAGSQAKASLEHTYLNVGRPPFLNDVHKNIESTTYVSLPLHITSLFHRMVTEGGDSKQDGGKHIGANVNPLTHDPFKLVLFNPGCVTSVVTLHNGSRPGNAPLSDFKSPFNKVTTSFNRLLRMGSPESNQASPWVSLVDGDEHNENSSFLRSKRSPRGEPVFRSTIDFDRKSYFSQISSLSTSKLLVSAHVNVLNVFAIDDKQRFANTCTFQATSSIFPSSHTPVPSMTASSNVSMASDSSSLAPYKKVVERPLLRVELGQRSIVTKVLTISSAMLVVLGMSSGDVIIVNLASLTYRLFNDFGFHAADNEKQVLSNTNIVTSLCAFTHPKHDILIVAGYSTGEVIILDPAAPEKLSGNPYTKHVVGKDRFITYFKMFDLSGLSKKELPIADDNAPPYLVGHFKVSHKTITSIATTIPYGSNYSSSKPMILAIASEDGLVRFIDLIATFGKNYGDVSNFYNSMILSDVVSNYFQDGVRCIDFSPDNRFFVMCGKGDLIEVFRMSYYNVNGLLLKNSGHSNKGGRSRSGTINSSSSSNLLSPASILSPPASSGSLDSMRDGTPEISYPPIIKDITIVSRLKGHANIVQNVSFVKKEQFFNLENGPVAGTYKLMSCGSDGKINFWEFSNKALPRAHKSHFKVSKRRNSGGHDKHQSQLHSVSSRVDISATPALARHHKRARSANYSDDIQLSTSFSNLGINNLLSLSPQPSVPQDTSEEQQKIVFSLYKSLFEVRLKKHYAKQAREAKSKYSCVIHGIVNDSELPSIQIPILTMDLSSLFRNADIHGLHCGPSDFWVFGKSGDIFKYTIDV